MNCELKSIQFNCKKCNKTLLFVEFVSVIKISSHEFILFCPQCKCTSTYLTAQNEIPASLSIGLGDEENKNNTKLFLKKVMEN